MGFAAAVVVVMDVSDLPQGRVAICGLNGKQNQPSLHLHPWPSPIHAYVRQGSPANNRDASIRKGLAGESHVIVAYQL